MRLVVFVALWVMACGGEPSRKSPPRESPLRTSAASPARDTIMGDTAGPPAMPILKDVRLAGHRGYERLVFEFEGPFPKYKVDWASGPVSQCGSGEVVPMDSVAVLRVRFPSANAHTEQGKASGAPREAAGQGRNIKQLKQICDFEGVVEWVVAVGRRGAFEVHEVANPAQLLVDVHY